MENFCVRLKEERERIGLSQAKFGEACKVGKTAQFNYEKGDRTPSLEYIDLAGKLGVDIFYLLCGIKTDVSEARATGLLNVLYEIQCQLGLKSGEIEKLNQKMLEEVGKGLWTYSDNQGHQFKKNFKSAVKTDVEIWLASATTPDKCFDLDLFSTILSELEAVLQRKKVILTPIKKSASAIMLYRVFKSSGKIENTLIEDTVKLAAS